MVGIIRGRKFSEDSGAVYDFLWVGGDKLRRFCSAEKFPLVSMGSSRGSYVRRRMSENPHWHEQKFSSSFSLLLLLSSGIIGF